MGPRHQGLLFLLAIFAVPFAWGPAQAASFPCTIAKSNIEKAICAAPSLSEDDEKLGALYKERLALLSPAGAAMLKASQRSWLRVMEVTCSFPGQITDDVQKKRIECLADGYSDRLQALATVAQRIGPYLFNRVDVYSAELAPSLSGDSSGYPEFGVRQISYPQIDAPQSSLEKDWNEINSHVPQKEFTSDCGYGGDYSQGFIIGYASVNLISVGWSDYTYCHGTAHGVSFSHFDNTSLMQTLHAFRATDLFGNGTNWQKPFADLAWAAVTADGWSPPSENSASLKAEFLTQIVDPDNWLFSTEGIQVNYVFAAYVGCRPCNPRPATISWKKLKPFLIQGAVSP